MRSFKSKKNGLISGINITPFTDVVLVLLVIFMIATPLLIQAGIKVNLPKASNAEAQSERNIVITIDSSGGVRLDKGVIPLPDLKTRLTALVAEKPDAPVIIMGDQAVRYDLVIAVLDAARGSGVKRLSLGVELKK
jgi:biopolymer transport protein ExbD